MDPSVRISVSDATLRHYSQATQSMLVPVLLYKSVYMGDWFQALIRHEPHEPTRTILTDMSRNTLREAIEMLAAALEWDQLPADEEARERLGQELRKAVVHDLITLKERSAERIMTAAMRMPTQALRERMVVLADHDRRHADELRGLLEIPTVANAVAREPRDPDAAPLGAHARREHGGTLGAEVLRQVERMRERGETPERLLVSHVVLRHLRDEGHVRGDGTCFGLHVEIMLGWEGECYALPTEARVSLAEVMSLHAAQRRPEASEEKE